METWRQGLLRHSVASKSLLQAQARLPPQCLPLSLLRELQLAPGSRTAGRLVWNHITLVSVLPHRLRQRSSPTCTLRCSPWLTSQTLAHTLMRHCKLLKHLLPLAETQEQRM